MYVTHLLCSCTRTAKKDACTDECVVMHVNSEGFRVCVEVGEDACHVMRITCWIEAPLPLIATVPHVCAELGAGAGHVMRDFSRTRIPLHLMVNIRYVFSSLKRFACS